MNTRIQTIVATLILAICMLAGCRPTATPAPTPAPTQIPESTPTQAPEPTATAEGDLQPLLGDEDRRIIQDAFDAMLVDPVEAVVFSAQAGCDYCPIASQLLAEVASLSSKLTAHSYDLENDASLAAQYNVDKVPAIAITGDRDYGIRFFGLPYGQEFTPLLQAIITVSQGQSGLSAETIEALAGLRTPLHIQVLVTPVCPYCPSVVSLAHRMALQSEYIRADAVETPEFPDLAQKYGADVVPAIVINEELVQKGQVGEAQFLQLVLAAAQKP
ncbi:MAG: glutaredoxin [Chloroflexi bacterium]|nr:glutaredoxin [Chloroflexota bacterium]